MGFHYINQVSFDKFINIEELPNNLDDLEVVVSNCNLCSLSNSRKSVLFGKGNESADVMFMSLSPSLLEDESGDLVYGEKGEMLTKMSQNILGLSISDIYVLNILKCMPTHNSNYIEAFSICKPYIQKQIDIINPKVIVAFGDVCKYLIDDTKILSKIRGIVQSYNGIKVVPTYDPLFILRNPSLKKDVLDDLEKVKSLMELF
jgi:DNA polymerase